MPITVLTRSIEAAMDSCHLFAACAACALSCTAGLRDVAEWTVPDSGFNYAYWNRRGDMIFVGGWQTASVQVFRVNGQPFSLILPESLGTTHTYAKADARLSTLAVLTVTGKQDRLHAYKIAPGMPRIASDQLHDETGEARRLDFGMPLNRVTVLQRLTDSGTVNVRVGTRRLAWRYAQDMITSGGEAVDDMPVEFSRYGRFALVERSYNAGPKTGILELYRVAGTMRKIADLPFGSIRTWYWEYTPVDNFFCYFVPHHTQVVCRAAPLGVIAQFHTYEKKSLEVDVTGGGRVALLLTNNLVRIHHGEDVSAPWALPGLLPGETPELVNFHRGILVVNYAAGLNGRLFSFRVTPHGLVKRAGPLALADLLVTTGSGNYFIVRTDGKIHVYTMTLRLIGERPKPTTLLGGSERMLGFMNDEGATRRYTITIW
ncbi:hypothetical protein GX586_06425 [bacterium]|nr:hypothetical protein [bacterium]